MPRAARAAPLLAALLVGSAGAQTVLEPGWTVAPSGSGISAFNGLEHDCSRGEFWLGDNGLGQFLRLDSLGNPTVIDSGPTPDEVALDRTLDLLVVQYKPLVNRVYSTAGTFLGEWSDGTTFTGLAFDSAGDRFVGTWDQGVVRRYPRGTLPPGASHPDARTHALYRALVKQTWPPAPLPSGLPATAIALTDVPRPPSLYYYRVARESCSGKVGPSS